MTTTTEPETSTQPEPAPKPRSLRRRILSRISIQSKLLVMLLVTSILSAAVVGAIGYQSGRSSLRASVFDRLTEIRASQLRQLEAKFPDLQDSLIIYTREASTTGAIEAFTAAFNQLNNSTVNTSRSWWGESQSCCRTSAAPSKSGGPMSGGRWPRPPISRWAR